MCVNGCMLILMLEKIDKQERDRDCERHQKKKTRTIVNAQRGQGL